MSIYRHNNTFPCEANLINHYLIINDLYLHTKLTSHFQHWQCSKMAAMLLWVLRMFTSLFINSRLYASDPCLCVSDKTAIV